MRVPELARTYKLLSRPEGLPFSIKFVGAVVGLLLVAGGGLYWVTLSHEPAGPPNTFALISTDAEDGTRTDYVGYLPATFNAALGFDPRNVDKAVRAWETQHEDVEVLSKEPRWSGGHVIGYDIRYQP